MLSIFILKQKILAQIINNPVSFNPRIVKEISTENDEYLPIISPDQELVFFTRRYQKNSLHSITNTTVEEFVMAKKLDEKFDVGDPLPYPFNMGSNEGGASVTIDNNILYFTKCIRNKKIIIIVIYSTLKDLEVNGLKHKSFLVKFLRKILGILSRRCHQMVIQLFLLVIEKEDMEKQIYMRLLLNTENGVIRKI